MSDKPRILFVDDEPRILRGLRRSLQCMDDQWGISFASSGQEALEILAERPFNVIVSDMRMPGMTGVELLNEVRKRHPQIVRLALSGQTSKESVLHSVGPIHQYLPKPCDIEALQMTLSRLWTLRNLLSVSKLRSLLARMEGLPSLPSMYKQLMEEFDSPDGSLKEVGRIVSQDMGMTAKVLHLVNSAFFGVPRHVGSPAQAVNALGMDTIKSLALSICVFSPFEEAALERFSIEPLWEHSAAVGAFAKRIARAEKAEPKIVDHALIGGMLHDVGKLAFASMLPEDYADVLARVGEEGIGLAEAEQNVIGATHAEIGAYLLGLWGFADSVMQAVAFHHDPTQEPRQGFSAVTAVHVANVLAHECFPNQCVHSQARIDHSYLDGLGLSGRLSVWTDSCRSIIPQKVS